MIHLYKSHSLPVLADTLAAYLSETEVENPLQPYTVMVPNRDTARWLTLHLARKTGMAANIRYLLPSEWMWKVIRKKFPDLPDHLASDLEAIKWALVDEFLKAEKSDPIYQIESYLSSRPEEQREKAAIKLAESIASVFDAYLFYRPEMISSWQQNSSQKGDAAWQARLWRQLSDRWQTLHGDAPYSHNKARLFEQVMASDDSLFHGEGPMRVFNPGLIPGPVVRMLKKAGKTCSVQIYQLQPTAEMEENSHPLFTSFGREAVRMDSLFQEIADQTHRLFEPLPSGPTLLETIQAEVIGGGPGPSRGAVKPLSRDEDSESLIREEEFSRASEQESTEPLSPEDDPESLSREGEFNRESQRDKEEPPGRGNTPNRGSLNRVNPGNGPGGCSSVQIRSCHSPLREIEVLHDFLLSRFEADETLQPEDILVVTPEPEQYIPYVRAVFHVRDGGLPRIPVHIAAPGAPGPAERAVTELLELAGSPFQKEDLLTLIRSEAVRAALRLSESDCDRIELWADENHVLWGLAYGEDQPEGSPVNNTWDKMMERGWMGQMLGDTDPLAGEPLVYDRIHDRSTQEVWASLAVFLRKLHTFRNGTKEKKSPDQWCVWFQHQIVDLFGREFLMAPDSENLVRYLQDLTDYSRLSGIRTALSFDQLRSELIGGLQQSGASGARFSRGVIFSSMVPVRGLPFRIIALVGLNDLAFPRRSGSPDFDLMIQDPRPGERNRKEEDRNLFLQSVLSASDVHYCSYVGQSKVDNEEIPPSVVLQQWVDILKGKTEMSNSQLIVREPITGFSEKKYTNSSPVYSFTYDRVSARMRTPGDWVAGLTGGLEPEAGSDENRGDPETQNIIRLRDLTSFVRSPASYFFQDRFHVQLSDFYREREEFSLSHLDIHLLFGHMLEWKIAGAGDPQILALLIDSGAVPHGWPGEREAKKMLRRAGRALDLIRSMGWTPAHPDRSVEVAVGEYRIRGALESRASEVNLDIYPSSFSGKNVVQSWVKHLVWGRATQQWDATYVLTDLKKEKPKISTFVRPEDPERILQGLVDLYQRGRSQPEIWMPDTITEYLTGMDGKEEADGHAKAKGVFEGGAHRFGESRREEVQLLMGADPVYSHTLVTGRFAKWMEEMVRHREDVK